MTLSQHTGSLPTAGLPPDSARSGALSGAPHGADPTGAAVSPQGTGQAPGFSTQHHQEQHMAQQTNPVTDVSAETRLRLVEKKVENTLAVVDQRLESLATWLARLDKDASACTAVGAQLAAALTKAQGEFGPIEKNCTNNYTHTRYADLAAVLAAVRPALAKHGLAVVQQSTCTWTDDLTRGSVTVTTRLVHESGEQLLDECTVPVLPMARRKGEDGAEQFAKSLSPQAFGIAITYARRYSISALLGVAPEEEAEGDGGARVRAQKVVEQAQAAQRRGGKGAGGVLPTPQALASWTGEELQTTIDKVRAGLEQVASDPKRLEQGKAYLSVLLEEQARRFSQLTEAPAA